MKKIISGLICLVTLSGLANPNALAQEDFKAVTIGPESGFNEGDTFVVQSWQGLQQFADNNQLTEDQVYYETAYNEQSLFSGFRQAVIDQVNLVFGIGQEAKLVVDEVAADAPDQNFVLIDAEAEAADNVASYSFKDYEAAFLAGLAAGLETESNHIGFVGGQNIPQINAFEQGFALGVEEVNPDAQVEVTYIDSFSDVSAATEAATELYNNGADIVFHAAGTAGFGVFDAAKQLIADGIDREIWVIGADYDQTSVGEFEVDDQTYSVTLTSTMKKVNQLVEEIAQSAYDGNFEAGHFELGMAENIIDIAAGNLQDETYDTVAQYRDEMQSGQLDISDRIKEAAN